MHSVKRGGLLRCDATLALPGPATVAHSGAGDIVNPAADDDTTSPIAGIQTMLDEVLVALEG